jgi:hypothetical protein
MHFCETKRSGKGQGQTKNQVMTTEVTLTLQHVLIKTNRDGCPNRFIHEHNLADEGGGDQPWVLGTLIYKGFKL